MNKIVKIKNDFKISFNYRVFESMISFDTMFYVLTRHSMELSYAKHGFIPFDCLFFRRKPRPHAGVFYCRITNNKIISLKKVNKVFRKTPKALRGEINETIIILN